MNSLALIDLIRQHTNYSGQIVHVETIPKQETVVGAISTPLHPHLAACLARDGIKDLFAHQAAAIEAVRRREHVIVVTPTASGKTICYNLPVLDTLLRDPQARAMYLFPTKSLSRDQLDTLEAYDLPFPAAVYDGDTPDPIKTHIREHARVLITNPDMVHQGILPNHLKWHHFFRHLRYVVIDEVHTYRGVFGTHVAHLLRRLRRICRHYGSDPVFITCSATIANPAEHAARLTGLPMTLIDNNGAPRGASRFVLWRPPTHQPYIRDVVWLLTLMLQNERRTIAFARARQTTERVLRYARRYLAGTPLESQLVSYRGGYLARERRQIEEALFHGRVLGVVSTNALELGIDVGDLEVCIIAGYPGTIASTWQQAGRVGRRRDESLVIFIAVENPLDQYFLHHTGALFTRPAEHALIDPRNPYLLLGHALCAAHELPVTPADYELWDTVLQDLLVLLEEDGQVSSVDGIHYYTGQAYPAEKVGIRTGSHHTYHLRDVTAGNRLVAVMDGQRAFSEVHRGAVYMHQGETYVVQELDVTNTTALLKKMEVDYYTMVKHHKETEILEVTGEKSLGTNTVYLGNLRVRTRVTGYVQKHETSGQVLGGGELDLPEQVLETVGMWFTVNEDIVARVQTHHLDLMGGMHAIEHAAIGLLPLLVMCDRNDIGGLSTVSHPFTRRPTVFIHDVYEGGVGFSEKAFQEVERLLDITLEAVMRCECEDGCPGCIHSPKCSNFNRPLDKEAAIYLLHCLLGRDYQPRNTAGKSDARLKTPGLSNLEKRLRSLR